MTEEVIKNLDFLGIDYLIPIGGDDTLSYGVHLYKRGGVDQPKYAATIDIRYTQTSFNTWNSRTASPPVPSARCVSQAS